MAEPKRKMKIVRPTYVDGELMGKGKVVFVTASEAREMLANGKAVPAGDQEKADNDPDDDLTAELEVLREAEKELQADLQEATNEVGTLKTCVTELETEGGNLGAAKEKLQLDLIKATTQAVTLQTRITELEAENAGLKEGAAKSNEGDKASNTKKEK